MSLGAKIKTGFSITLVLVVAFVGYSIINPGRGGGPVWDRQDEREAVTLTINFEPASMPKGHVVVIDAYVTGMSCPIKECHFDAKNSPWNITFHAHKGQVVHLSALQDEMVTTKLECWIHHRGKDVAHDLKIRGIALCDYKVV